MRGPRALAAVVAAAAVMFVASARADEPPHAPRRRTPLAVGAALVPGAVVHGLGHVAAGDPRTGLTLAGAQGVGAAMIGVGLATTVASGASRKLVGPAASLIALGAGLWFLTWLMDVYGVVSPDEGLGAPRRVLPRVEAATGIRHVYDPTLPGRAYLLQSFDFRVHRLRLRPEGWFSPGGTASRVELRGGARIYGPLAAGDADDRARDGSFLDAEVAVSRHSLATERFEIGTAEGQLAGRLDLARVGRTLRGAFAEASAGLAVSRYAYAVARAGPDFAELLLARFAWGLYLGRPSGVWGEALVYYDHRHDGVVGGGKLLGLGSGVPGSVGAKGRMYFAREWGIELDAAAGSALMAGASILVRAGGAP